jgi:hypothetical protein
VQEPYINGSEGCKCKENKSALHPISCHNCVMIMHHAITIIIIIILMEKIILLLHPRDEFHLATANAIC